MGMPSMHGLSMYPPQMYPMYMGNMSNLYVNQPHTNFLSNIPNYCNNNRMPSKNIF
jgi:hypothetical protein